MSRYLKINAIMKDDDTYDLEIDLNCLTAEETLNILTRINDKIVTGLKNEDPYIADNINNIRNN